MRAKYTSIFAPVLLGAFRMGTERLARAQEPEPQPRSPRAETDAVVEAAPPPRGDARTRRARLREERARCGVS